MTLLVILIFGILGALWLPANGPYVIGNLSVYDTIFVAGLASCSIAALVSGSIRSLLGASVLIGNFIVSHFVWTDSDPILTAAILDIATAAYFILCGQARWELMIGGLYLVSVLAAAGTWLDVIPDQYERAPGIVAWSFPDIAVWLSHLANVILGAGAGDWGKRVRARVLSPVPRGRAAMSG